MSTPAVDVVPSFDQFQAQVEPGVGIVARFPGIIAVCGAVTPERAGILDRFLTICSEVSAGGARAPGRRLARALAGWLADVEDAPTLGTVSPTDGGLAVFLSGAATLRVSDGGDRLSGRDSAGWLDRIIEWPAAFGLTVDADQGIAFTPSLFDLRQGVVPGIAAVLSPPRTAVPGSPAIAEPPEPMIVATARPEPVPSESADAEPVMAVEPERLEPVMAEPIVADSVMLVPPPQIVTPAPEPTGVNPPAVGAPIPSEPRPPLLPPMRSARIEGVQGQEPPRPALPLPSVAGEPVPAVSDGTPKVQGFLCARGHLNDPRGLFCGICGLRMAERTGILTIGRRPPLGLLVFDDGVTFTVDADYLLGREPDSDPRVRQGSVRPLVVADARGAVSRRHCEIRLDGWQVVLTDIGSANGTFIAPRGIQTWSALVPQHAVPLEAGTRIRLGNRMLVFESPHGAP